MSETRPDSLTVRELQQEVDRYISQFKEGYWHPLSILARITEEVGELAREINHRFGEKPKRKDEGHNELALEIGDILFILACLANSQGIALDDAFRQVMTKYQVRDAGRWTLKTDGEPAG